MSRDGLGTSSMVFNTSSDTLLESDSHNRVYFKAEERLLPGGFQSSRPRSILRRSIPFFKSPVGIVLALAGLLLVLVSLKVVAIH
jgi:hypothetical protein